MVGPFTSVVTINEAPSSFPASNTRPGIQNLLSGYTAQMAVSTLHASIDNRWEIVDIAQDFTVSVPPCGARYREDAVNSRVEAVGEP